MAGPDPKPMLIVSPGGTIIDTSVPHSSSVEGATIPPVPHTEGIPIPINFEKETVPITPVKDKPANIGRGGKGAKRQLSGSSSGSMPKMRKNDKTP